LRGFWDWRHTKYDALASSRANAKQPSRTTGPSHVGASSIASSFRSQLARMRTRVLDARRMCKAERCWIGKGVQPGARCGLSNAICTSKVERYPGAIQKRLLQNPNASFSTERGEHVSKAGGSLRSRLLYSELGLPTLLSSQPPFAKPIHTRFV